jgi:hypothetical protein
VTFCEFQGVQKSMIELRAALQDRAPERVVNNHEELEATLMEACAAARGAGKLNVIFLYAPNGDHLTLVVGGDETVVGFNYGHGDPSYYASMGAATVDEPVLTAYVGLAHHTEFPRRWVVPCGVGKQAASEFLATGKRPEVVSWVEL